MRRNTVTPWALTMGAFMLVVGVHAPTARADGRLFWITAEGGRQSLDLHTFDAGDVDQLSAGLVPARVSGPTFAVATGLRLMAVTIGVRVAGSDMSGTTQDGPNRDLQLWTIGGELGTRFQLWWFEPYLTFGVGYATLGGLDDAFRGLGKGLDVDGLDLRAAAGLDVFPIPLLSLGIRVSGDALFLSRPGIPVRELATPEYVETLGQAKARVLEADGASAGIAWSITGLLGLHL